MTPTPSSLCATCGHAHVGYCATPIPIWNTNTTAFNMSSFDHRHCGCLAFVPAARTEGE